ncbi:MAG: hypothetical protein AB1427_00335 [Thermodesulfobacteriota bacterium]
MGIDINIKRTFKVNGKEYNSVAEMPPEIRAAFEKAMASPARKEPRISFAKTQTKISFNGAEYENMDAMPPDARRLYEKIMQAAAGGGQTPDGDLLKDILGTETSKTVRSQKQLKQIRIEPSFASRKFIYVAGLGALILFLYFVFRGL